MSVEPVCIGDSICLYSEETDGFVYSLQSSDVFPEVAIGIRQDKAKPLVPDPQVVSFSVCVANRYKQDKSLRKLLEKKSTENSYALQSTISQAQLAAKAEEEDNQVEMTRQTGKKLLYGQTIQLRHQFTRKYVHASTTITSRSESNNMLVELLPYNAKHAQFRVMPRYKVKAEGDVVFIGDQVVFESMKSPGQYLHVSRAHFAASYVYADAHELGLSVRQSGFSITRQRKPEKNDENKLRAGTPIRLFHKEIEAYLVAEGLFDDEVTEDVHFRLRPMNQNNPKTLFPSTSAITYWQFELEDRSLESGLIMWEQQVRVRHMITRKYLKINKEGKIMLEDTNVDPMTVFRLHPVIREKDEIEYETYCRIEHVVTGKWISTSQEAHSPKRTNAVEGEANSMASLKWTKAHLSKVSTDDDMKYDDAFTVQLVEDDLVDIFNFMAGCVPFIQKLISQRKAGKVLNAKQAHNYVLALDQMCKFMIVEGDPSKNRQKLLRNFRLVELLVRLLQTPLRGATDVVHLQKIFAKAYDVLYHYLQGNSRKNELYIAKHIDFFQTQFDLGLDPVMYSKEAAQGDIGLKAVHMVMELIKDNRKIVDRITNDHIDTFVQLLTRKKNFQYLDLLSVLCVCDGMALPENQEYITRAWLMSSRKNVVYNTDLGQKIGKEPNIVYVSTDNARTWTALHDFVARRDESNEANQKFLFLTHQLDLFGKLCFGRNRFAINVITEELCYLTWEEAFLCLSNEQLPDDLRAKYCELIIAMFVDIDENVSVLDRIKLTFVYDEVNNNADDEFGQSMPRSKVTMQYFPQIRDWISNFLDHNKDMTASLIGHNLLVEQVLRLVHYLVMYGYYGNTDDIKQLMQPLLDLMDGRNDKPYPKEGSSRDSKAYDMVLQNYRTKARFAISREAKAVTDAKHQAMDVLELLFNFRFNTRLEQFVFEFKNTHQMANSPSGEMPEIGNLLYETFDIEGKSTVCKAALRRLEEMFHKTDYLRGSFDLVAILMDLSEYKYDKMLIKSMALLNRYYSANDNLFKRAVQAQVLITPQSVEVYKKVLTILPTLQRLGKSKLSNDAGVELAGIIDQLTTFCHLENEPEEPHPMNQRILYNFNLLSDIFDILGKEYDVKLAEQYQGMRATLQASFRLLKAISRGNAVVQGRLFDQLDFLLAVKGAESDMAEAVLEIFTGNKVTCMKVLAYQIQAIMQLAAEHRSDAPQFLDLLNAIVKVEELNLPLKRNQGYVMKYFMQHRSEVAGPLELSQTGKLALLRTNNNIKELRYMLSMVDLLSTCAEGENRFIESICQTIFSLEDLLEILTDKSLSNSVKKPFLRFMLWVYMNTAGGIIESGAGDLPHDKQMWQFLEMTVEDLERVNSYVKENPEVSKQLLKEEPNLTAAGSLASKLKSAAKQMKSIESSSPEHAGEASTKSEYSDSKRAVVVGEMLTLEITPTGKPNVTDVQDIHGSLHYYFDALMPALQVFFRSYYQPDPDEFDTEAETVNLLASKLMTFVDCVGPSISDDLQLKTMVTCVSSVLSSSNVSVKVMEEFQDKYGRAGAQAVCSDARKRYIEECSEEEELNDQLNVFAENYAFVYGGRNDIKTQIGFDSNEEYTEVGGNEELPLGREFQDHMAVFVTDVADPTERYARAVKLIDQLAVSASLRLANERDRLAQNDLDIKCFQLLRGLIHNEIIKLPADSEENVKKSKRQLQNIANVQRVLEDHHAILKVLPHLSKNQSLLVREILSFMAAMLYGGNTQVQMSLIDYFYGTREEKFFFAVKNRIDLSTMAVKEQRSLQAQYRAKVEEAVEMAKSLKKAMMTAKSNHLDIDVLKGSMFGSRMGSSRMSVNRFGSSRMMGARTVQGVGAAPGRSKMRGKNSKKNGSYMSLNGSTQDLSATTNGIHDSDKKKNGKKSQVAPIELEEVKVKDPAVLDNEEIAEIEAMASQEMEMEYEDDGYIELVLKVLGLMCDGQNASLQNYLREQPDNIKSFNLVGETARFLQLLYSNINPNTISLIIQVFSTLTEFCSGNAFNQSVAFDNKVIDYVNYILRNKQYKTCKSEDVLELQAGIQQLVKAMCEENRSAKDSSKPSDKTSSYQLKEVMDTLDLDSIHDVVLSLYDQMCTHRHSDSYEEITQVAFGYYHLIRRYEDIDPESDIKAMRKRVDISWLDRPGFVETAWKYFEGGTMSIEILKDDQLQKAYFHVRDRTVLREEIKDRFNYEVDRSSPTNKLREFLDWSKAIMEDIKYQKKILSNPVSRFFVKSGYWLDMAILVITFLIAFLVLATWIDPAVVENMEGQLYLNGDNSSFTAAKPRYRSEMHNYPLIAPDLTIEQLIMYILAAIHNVLSLCVVVSFFLSNHPKFPTVASIKQCFRIGHSEENEPDDDDEPESHLQVQFFSAKTMYYLLFLVFSFLGTAYYGYFFAFHLVHITNNNQLLKRVMMAITRNGQSLLWVFILGLIFLYIYALIAFALFRDLHDEGLGMHCNNMYECFVNLVHKGMILSTLEVFWESDISFKSYEWHMGKFLFDFTFFIIITTIGLNIIFGIIVDTFSELRDSKWQIDQDMRNACFICSRESYDFEHHPGGFEKHIKQEHYQWAYLFFFIHLRNTMVNDYSAIELFVHRQVLKDNINFFPLNRAMSLEDEEDSNEVKIDTLLQNVTYIVQKMKEQETLKFYEEEERKQQEWIEKNTKIAK